MDLQPQIRLFCDSRRRKPICIQKHLNEANKAVLRRMKG
nr:MAG TPA: hypothetical protein [Caudoviricetes sp.]